MHPDTLRQLIANCRRKSQRKLGFPRDWQPYNIKNPEFDGYFFTDDSAFEFIANKLEAGHDFEEILLDVPKNATGIVMKVKLPNTEPILYIKLQLGIGSIAIGRSFHCSDY